MFAFSHAVLFCANLFIIVFIVYADQQQLDDAFLEPNITVADRNIMNTHYNTLVKQPKKIHGLFANSTRIIEPIIFVPGLGGSALDARLADATEAPSWFCHHNSDWFRLWVNVIEWIPWLSLSCWVHNMTPIFDRSSRLLRNAKGVSIRAADYGGVGGVRYLDNGLLKEMGGYTAKMIHYFKEFGYEEGISFRGAGFDWRVGPNEWVVSGEYQNFKNLIEDTFHKNNNAKVHLIGHSLGSPFISYFLAKFVDQAWKDRHVASLIALGGGYGGTMVSIASYILGTNYGIPILNPLTLRPLVSKFGSLAWMVPSLEQWKSKVVVVSKHKNYTIGDLNQLFSDIGHQDTFDIVEQENKYDKMLAPNVKVHCIYGTHVPTVAQIFVDNVQNPSNVYVTKYESGDGVVTVGDLALCDLFKQEQQVTVHKFKGTDHALMIQEHRILDQILMFTTKNKHSTHFSNE